MGQRLIKQPNGKYSVFSTITEDLMLVDYTRQELVDHYVQEAAVDTRLRTEEWVDGEAPGRKIWTPEEIHPCIELNNGKDRADEAMREMLGEE